ncbi:MAG: molecular chaperone DnaJ [Desulfobulbus propionicus]|nr:MAG: molecular chaperone DnaJ [Desulfobulbus propionicus]
MNRKYWQQVQRAKNILCLGEDATLSEIKQAYHALSKKYHPDRVSRGDGDREGEQMYHLTEAYELLMKYCTQYRFPLEPPENEPLEIYDPEEWWKARFGEEPVWGKKTTR